jgi:hypothetical protein
MRRSELRCRSDQSHAYAALRAGLLAGCAQISEAYLTDTGEIDLDDLLRVGCRSPRLA